MFSLAEFLLLAFSAVLGFAALEFLNRRERRTYREKMLALDRDLSAQTILAADAQARLSNSLDREIELHRRVAALQALLDAKLRDGLPIPPPMRQPRKWADAAQAALDARTAQSRTTDATIALNAAAGVQSAAADSALVTGMMIASTIAGGSAPSAATVPGPEMVRPEPAAYSPPYEAPSTSYSMPSSGDTGAGGGD